MFTYSIAFTLLLIILKIVRYPVVTYSAYNCFIICYNIRLWCLCRCADVLEVYKCLIFEWFKHVDIALVSDLLIVVFSIRVSVYILLDVQFW